MKKSRKKLWSRVGLGANALALAGGTGLSFYELRQNNLKMLELYNKVQTADQTGAGVYEALSELQLYVASHMNTTPPKIGDNASIQLKNSYERAIATEKARVATARDNAYNEAQAYCRATLPGNWRPIDWANCMSSAAGRTVIQENVVVADLYRYDFVSPKWSPDLAGWSVVATAVVGAVLILRIASRFLAVFLIKK